MRIRLLFLPLCLAMLLILASTALAKKQRQPENIDFGSITCQQFNDDLADADEDTVGIVFMWLDGYLSGVSGDTRLDWKGLESFTVALVKGCANAPDSKVLDVAKVVGINRN